MKTYYWWGAFVTVTFTPIIMFVPEEPLKIYLFGMQVLSFALQIITGTIMLQTIRRRSR